jgi:hypothetical protein
VQPGGHTDQDKEESVRETWRARLFRRLAGKVFATGMLLYGKEPSLAEMVRWAREG